MKTFIFSSVMFFMAAATVLIGQNKIGCQAWSFNGYTLEETLEKMETLNIKYIESMLNNHQRGIRDYSEKIWSLLFLNEWLKQNY